MSNFLYKFKKSLLVWLSLFIFLYWLGSYLVNYNHKLCYIWSDGEGYYLYLPAVFFHGSFENLPIRTPYEYQNYPGTNKTLTRFTYGVALMESPFWTLAVLSRKIQGYDIKEDYARDYSVAILLAACFYTTLGLYFLYRTLQRHFSNKWVVGLTVFMLIFGTNLLYNAIRQPGMSHPYTFCLMSLLIYFLPKLYEDKTLHLKIAVGISFLAGLIILIRPTNLIILALVLGWNIQNLSDVKGRFLFFKNNLINLPPHF